MDTSGVSMKALERAVAVVNRIVLKSSVQPGNSIPNEGKAKGKWTKISAKAKGQTPVQEVRKPERSLARYLALPVEEYSLLDPSWITREPDSNVFCLSAPVRGITGVELEPKVWVTVDVDAEKGTVSFRSDRACTGDPSMDARLQISFEGKLWQQPPKPRRASSRWRASKATPQETASSASTVSVTSAEEGHPSRASVLSSVSLEHTHSNGDSAAVLQNSRPESQAARNGSTSAPQSQNKPEVDLNGSSSSSSTQEVSFVASIANSAAPAAAQDSSESSASIGSSTLHANAKVWASVRLGPPLNVVPGFLISYTGGLIATAVLQALMPSVLELLARDYATWATGEQRAALVEPADAAVPAAELVHP